MHLRSNRTSPLIQHLRVTVSFYPVLITAEALSRLAPATAGPDLGRHNNARIEIVGYNQVCTPIVQLDFYNQNL